MEKTNQKEKGRPKNVLKMIGRKMVKRPNNQDIMDELKVIGESVSSMLELKYSTKVPCWSSCIAPANIQVYYMSFDRQATINHN